VAAFFICIALMLAGMTLWEYSRPDGNPRKSASCRIETTRGDRLFIGLLGSAYINLAWLGLAGWFRTWFSLGRSPRIWIAFVLSRWAGWCS
jgi:predicted small integral membrane protein